jgi:hypothetical protein
MQDLISHILEQRPFNHRSSLVASTTTIYSPSVVDIVSTVYKQAFQLIAQLPTANT